MFKQEGLEANLAYTDLYKKRALILKESIVLLKYVIVKGKLYY